MAIFPLSSPESCEATALTSSLEIVVPLNSFLSLWRAVRGCGVTADGFVRAKDTGWSGRFIAKWWHQGQKPEESPLQSATRKVARRPAFCGDQRGCDSPHDVLSRERPANDVWTWPIAVSDELVVWRLPRVRLRQLWFVYLGYPDMAQAKDLYAEREDFVVKDNHRSARHSCRRFYKESLVRIAPRGCWHKRKAISYISLPEE